MSSGYQVVMSDLRTAAGVYASESKTLAGVAPQDGPARADGGDGTINSAMSDALKAAGLTTQQFAGVIDAHAGKLRSAYARYHGTEESMSKLIGQLTSVMNDGGAK